MSFYERYIARLAERYPKAAKRIVFRDRVHEQLVSPHVVNLPIALKLEAEQIVQAFFALRQDLPRQKRLADVSPQVKDPGHTSVLMSYDFHVDESGHLRLIEINTNASMSLLADTAYDVQSVKNLFADEPGGDFRKEILSSFEAEFQSATGRPENDLKMVAIVDENPTEQKLFVEFELYRELFENSGRSCEITDPRDLSMKKSKLSLKDQDIDLVYNRSTDFYFERPESAALKTASESHVACVTPHPFEYRLLADKERLLELSQPNALENTSLSTDQIKVIRDSLIRTIEVSKTDEKELWANRKKWFFKPMRSYGGKAVYRGASITKSTYAKVREGEYLAQEYVPPALQTFKTLEEDVELKYDLRFFVYRDRIQIACARLYRGQMTNAHTPQGGLAVIKWQI